MTKDEALNLALEALESKHIVNCGAWRVQQDQAITAIKEVLAQTQEEKLHPVHIGVDVTKEGTAVTAFYRKPDAVMEMFYSQFHPLAQPEQKCPNLVNCKGWCFQCEYFDSKTGETNYSKPEQEPVAWVYPEGLEALKAGKPWTAYGTRQEPNNTALYLSPQPDISPYAWVTFTPYGDEDDVWYENPEGQLLEGWTYKPLYDTTPPKRKPLTDEQIQFYADQEMDVYSFARAIEAAHGIKEKNT